MRDECFMKNIISRLIRILMCWDGRKMRLLLSRAIDNRRGCSFNVYK